MKKQSVRITTVLTLTLVFMLLMLGGCGRQKDTTEISEPVSAAESPSQAEPADSSEAGSGKKDGRTSACSYGIRIHGGCRGSGHNRRGITGRAPG